MKHRAHPSRLAALLIALPLILASCTRKLSPVAVPPPAPTAGAASYMSSAPHPAGVGTDLLLQQLRPVNDHRFADTFFRHYGVNPTLDTTEEPTSTFSVDVDTASYNVTRAYLEQRVHPPEAAVRVEEFVNAFDYAYPPPPEDEVFGLQAEAFPSPNRHGYHVLHLGLKGFEVEPEARPPAHLVFVIDVSGSMDMDHRLGLVKASLRLLVGQLGARDTVGLVVYGSRGREVLRPTGRLGRRRLLAAIDSLRPGGSTNAQEGILLGYRMAARYIDAGGGKPGDIHRIVLCSDGVANNGISTSADGIFDTIREEAARGITISTVGFGMANYNDVLMERLAQVGDGNYHYVDRLGAARKIFVEDLTATLQVIARDVKIQVEFDPAAVSRYRLLGYENRRLEHEDFADDLKDAGEIGAGHAVTALYEVKLTGEADLGTLRVRYKSPDGGPSTRVEKALPRSIVRPSLATASPSARLSLLVAAFAEKLRGSYWVRNLGYDDILALHEGLDLQLAKRREVRELRSLIVLAEGLDERGDRFASTGDIGEMDFDRVPSLR